MRRALLLRASLSLSLGWLAFSASGQVTMTTTATNSGKSYLGVDNRAVVTNIDTLFARLNALSSLTWGDVLDNGAQASQDLDLNGHIATGANRIEADSLEAARAEIMDSLLVRGDADFDGNLLVGEWVRTRALRADSSLAVSGTASNWNTTALGGGSSANSVNAVALGYSATASAINATAIGSTASASGTNSIALGYLASAAGTQSVALGNGASAGGSNANVAVGVGASVAGGWGNIAVGGGRLTGSSPTHNVAIGYSTISANGAYNVSMGYNSTISGGSTTGSMTFGPSSSVSTGYRNMAFGANSAITGGNSNYTFGDNSSATGGWNSAAFGCNAQIQSGGDNAYAFGHNSSVSAYNAVNFASNSPARFSNIALFGSYADTTALVPSAFSPNSWITTDPIFVVANGATNASRSNALTILKNGTATFNDSLSVLGNATFANELSVGDTLRAAAPALFADSVYIQGNLEINGNLTVNGIPVGAGTTYTAGTGVNISGSNVISIGQGVATTDNVTFNSANISSFIKLTPTTAPSSPSIGTIYYDSASNRLRVYTNTGWFTLDAPPV